MKFSRVLSGIVPRPMPQSLRAALFGSDAIIAVVTLVLPISFDPATGLLVANSAAAQQGNGGGNRNGGGPPDGVGGGNGNAGGGDNGRGPPAGVVGGNGNNGGGASNGLVGPDDGDDRDLANSGFADAR